MLNYQENVSIFDVKLMILEIDAKKHINLFPRYKVSTKLEWNVRQTILIAFYMAVITNSVDYTVIVKTQYDVIPTPYLLRQHIELLRHV